MKNLFTTALLLIAFANISFADVPKVTKKNGGLFGYKSVTEVVGEGQHTLTCTDPGRTRCRPMSSIYVDGTLTLSAEELELIDTEVDHSINVLHKESGKFVYDSKSLIVFSYSPETDLIVYYIYSIQQATNLNLM